ncbi:DUF411 domain-containing protein [Seohaeicola nanhaiensis]|uniref:DUF411 domain-containing protein n=1 Tax=Seohaeicola nanhaiensis TaxID=1387282 RepID=A0ABV9KKR2_9RHOB
MKKILALTLGVAGAGAAAATWLATDHGPPLPVVTSAAAQGAEHVTIWRAPGCGCCDAYAEYLRNNGFAVEVIDDRDFDDRSVDAGVPERGIGCHLAMIDGYVVSGLVPSEIIGRLLEERPDITGITLPGMPANAPGMAPEKTGTLRVYSFGPDGVAVYSDE